MTKKKENQEAVQVDQGEDSAEEFAEAGVFKPERRYRTVITTGDPLSPKKKSKMVQTHDLSDEFLNSRIGAKK